MRTTVNLDDDVAAGVDRLRRARGLGLSEAVNELARAGLVDRSRTPEVVRLSSRDLKLRLDVSNVAEALEAAENFPDR
ncbi:MAG: ribbon-helix-helix protein, CopG family [Nocardioidaceae bacterium]|nr:ribbon-helix-helix protein, CopG family [Nocardioidaceae bacterium]